jgi:hypothetical protein
VPRDLEELIYEIGYRPEDDSWDVDGRRTFVHDDDASRQFLMAFRNIIAIEGWVVDLTTLRKFRHPASGEIIEIEPGGNCDGHLLHHMKGTVE